ncbi:MAG TPA: hypothetical protein VKU41_10815 [Polyangiaceae bacterium]|nr:hypothetical protein [Polyangiaceae bacterium]
MTRQPSDSDVGRRLVSLTATVQGIASQATHREESSGFFNLAALRMPELERVMERVQSTNPLIRHVQHGPLPAPKVPPRRSPPPLPPAAAWQWPAPQPPSAPVASWPRPVAPVPVPVPVPHEPVYLDPPRLRPYRRTGKNIGWYAIAVAWLATTSLGLLSATTVPAHTLAGAHAPGAPASATAVHAATTPVPAGPIVVPDHSTPWQPVVTAVTMTPAPAPVVPAAPKGLAPIASPNALPMAGRPHARPAPRPAPPPPPASRPAVAALRSTPPAASPTPAPEPAEPAPVAAAPPPPPKVAPPPPAPAAAPGPSTPLSTGGSLEDLIRREVAAESKKQKH